MDQNLISKVKKHFRQSAIVRTTEEYIRVEIKNLYESDKKFIRGLNRPIIIDVESNKLLITIN